MYSLYRAWFGASNPAPAAALPSLPPSSPSEELASYPRLMDTLSPADTLVRVGNDDEYQFVAHRAVLSAHSGYLKALLATTSSDSESRSGDASQPIVASISVPSTIGGEAFAPLLNYMYTGRLEVTLDNIYTVLLATHLLHMPGALEQCRAALLRLRAPPILPPPPIAPPSPPPPPPSSILHRPVPNRLLSPAFCWAAAAQNAAAAAVAASQLYGAPRGHHLEHLTQRLQAATGMQSSVVGLSGGGGAMQGAMTGQMTSRAALGFAKERSISPPSSANSPAPRSVHSGSASPELVVVSSVSSVTQRSSPSSSAENDDDDDNNKEKSAKLLPSKKRKTAPSTSQQQSKPKVAKSRSSHTDRSSPNSSSTIVANGGVQTAGVVFDVACCDGPVRFHRVLNENYAPPSTQQQQQQQTPSSSNQRISLPHCNGRTSSTGHSQHQHHHRDNSNDSTSSSSNHHNNHSRQSRENDENNDQQQQQQNSGSSDSRSYSCGYCQHTFKSQYCYRKHARRHLLPADSSRAATPAAAAAGAVNNGSESSSEARRAAAPVQSGESSNTTTTSGKKREVRLLDLNVQYYPCKICGSKFPSYYFVHKHRKLCHANVDEPQQSGRSDDAAAGANNAGAKGKLDEQQQASTSEKNLKEQQQQVG